MPCKRYCTIKKSLKDSCKQVKLIRNGKSPEKTWEQVRLELHK